MTVLGPVPRRDMGLTLPHEHLIVRHQGPLVDTVDVVTAREEMQRFARLGGRTVFEMSNVGLGRDPVALQQIACEASVNVVMGTGFYKEGWLSPEERALDVSQMTDLMVKDIVDGVDGTGIRAGVIGEIGCSRPIRKVEEQVLMASAAAQRATGAVISVHFDIGGPDDERRQAVDILEAEGADLGRVVVEHFTCRPDELELAVELAGRGCWIEFDLWGMELWHKIADLFGCPPEVQIASLNWFISAGILDQILISQDVANIVNLRKYGGYGQSHILRNLVPLFRAQGITDDQINRIMVENPSRLFPFP